MSSEAAQPPIASQEAWLEARKKLLDHEKAVTREYDRVAAERRRLPMVKIEKDYVFEGPNGKVSLLDTFEGQKQLVVYHFMFGPEWEKGCPGCTGFVNAIGDRSSLKDKNTTFALISRAPYEKLAAYKAEKGWKEAWYSSLGSDFNYDFHVSFDKSKAPYEYNFLTEEELAAKGINLGDMEESHGLSVFFRSGDEVFHTYSTYARGVERLTDTYDILDVTPYGRQEDWEDSPDGWPQNPTYG